MQPLGIPRRCQVLLLALAVLLLSRAAAATDIPPLRGRVNDNAGILAPETKRRLTDKLAAYEQATGHQLAVLTLETLGGDPIEDYSIRVVEAWKLGQKGSDDGILLLVVSGDRKLRIEVGYGLEGALPDAAAGRIVRDIITPHFKAGDFDRGVSEGVDAILAQTGAEALAGAPEGSSERGVAAEPPPRRSPPSGIWGWIGFLLSMLFKIAFFGIFVLIVIVLALLNTFGRAGRARGTFIGGGFGASSGGGGGFFSGGGGSFGGGGASGSW